VHLEVDSLFSLLLPWSDRSREDRMFAYDAAHHLTRMLLARGTTVVLECTYARRDQRAGLRDALADVSSAQLWVVELFVSPDTAVRRFRARDEATDLDENSVHERAAAFPYLDQAHRLTASTPTPDEMAEALLGWWRAGPPAVDPDAWVDAGRAWT
jgi:predicted kinase